MFSVILGVSASKSAVWWLLCLFSGPLLLCGYFLVDFFEGDGGDESVYFRVSFYLLY